MNRIKVKWDAVETAFERNSPDLQSYIERETGEVLVVSEGSPEGDEARRRISVNPEGYVKIEPASSREQYRWMEHFVATVEDGELRERLLLAIDGKGAFRRFKDVLLSYPVERERWFTYRADLLHYHINEWFESKGLDPEPPSPWGEVKRPPEPEELPLPVAPSGQGPADMLRKQLKTLIDMLPACELHSARVILEFLREKGAAELAPVQRPQAVRPVDEPAAPPDELPEVERAPDPVGPPERKGHLTPVAAAAKGT